MDGYAPDAFAPEEDFSILYEPSDLAPLAAPPSAPPSAPQSGMSSYSDDISEFANAVFLAACRAAMLRGRDRRRRPASLGPLRTVRLPRARRHPPAESGALPLP